MLATRPAPVSTRAGPTSFGIEAANRQAKDAARRNRRQRRAGEALRQLVLTIDAAIASCEEAHLDESVELTGRARETTALALAQAERLLAGRAGLDVGLDGDTVAIDGCRMKVADAMEVLWQVQARAFDLLAPHRVDLLARDED